MLLNLMETQRSAAQHSTTAAQQQQPLPLRLPEKSSLRQEGVGLSCRAPLPGSAYAMSKQKSLAERLANLTSAAPSEAFNPDEPDFDDGTGAGIVLLLSYLVYQQAYRQLPGRQMPVSGRPQCVH